MRDVDIENADRLKRMPEIMVLESISEIEGIVRRHIEGDCGAMCAILSVDEYINPVHRGNFGERAARNLGDIRKTAVWYRLQHVHLAGMLCQPNRSDHRKTSEPEKFGLCQS